MCSAKDIGFADLGGGDNVSREGGQLSSHASNTLGGYSTTL